MTRILHLYYLYVTGTDEEIDDDCGRNGIEMEKDDYDYERGQVSSYYDEDDDDDRCFEVLSRGPCQETEIVLVNPLTKKVNLFGCLKS